MQSPRQSISSADSSRSWRSGSFETPDWFLELTSRPNSLSVPPSATWVCHTSTIPYAHILVKFLDAEETSHNSCDCCMYRDHKEPIFKVCPCQPRPGKCFLDILPTINKSYVQDENKDFLPQDIMFCPDHSGLFDHYYKSYVSNVVRKSGWHVITKQSEIERLFSHLYWFNRRLYKEKASRRLRQLFAEGVEKAKYYISQILGTINGILTKFFLTSGDLKLGYKEIADWTQQMFIDLATDYLGIIPRVGFYESVKDFCKLVKSVFTHEKPEERQKILDFEFPKTNWGIGNFFKKYKKKILSLPNSDEYIMSIQWLVDMSIWCQTRNMGYLPEYLAERSREDFYKLVTDKEPPEDKKIISAMSLMNEGLKLQFPKEHRILDPGQPENAIDEILGQLKFPIKPSASTNSTVGMGGRVEDARQVMVYLLDNQIKLPVYDLWTGELREPITPTLIDTNEVFLFWYSFQMILNYMIERNHIERKELYFDFPKDPPLKEGIYEVEILHIQEPAKERTLTKGNSLLTWFLTPGSKFLQLVLARNPDHKAGLEESNQGWKINREWGPYGKYNDFMYDDKGNTLPDIWICDADWSQASDCVKKAMGLGLLLCFEKYIGFPQFYREIFNLSLSIKLKLKDTREVIRYIPEPSNRYIFRGFMMGLPVTKAILHLCHIVEKQIAIKYCKFRGIYYNAQNKPFRGFLLPIINREKLHYPFEE